MEHYGKPADLAHLMHEWVGALLRARDFLQQMDPLTGEFTADAPGYSPAALVLLDFTWRLAGVRCADGNLEWNLRPPSTETRSAFRLRVTPYLTAELRYEHGAAEVRLNDRLFAKVSGTIRLITTQDGRLQSAVGIADHLSLVSLHPVGKGERIVSIEPNTKILLS